MLYPNHLLTGDACNESQACRRVFTRLTPRQNVYIAYGQRAPYVGEMQDAAMGGVSFDYVQMEKPLSHRNHLDIFAPDLGIRIRQLPCRMVYKIAKPVDLNNRYAFVPIQVYRCGLAFGELTETHATDLKRFLESRHFHT